MSATLGVVAGVFGLVIGSFFGVVVDRIPRNESIVSPPSHCVACSAPVRGYDNIPVVSYVLLRGRCRVCRVRIPPRDAMLELGTAAAFVLLAWRLDSAWTLPAFCVLAASLVAISAIDVEHLRIPSPIVYVGGRSGRAPSGACLGGNPPLVCAAQRPHRRRGRLRGLLRPLLRRSEGDRFRRRAPRGAVRSIPRLDRLSGGRRRLPSQLHHRRGAGCDPVGAAQGAASDPDFPSGLSSPPARSSPCCSPGRSCTPGRRSDRR